jgi:hypothetical protein
MPNLPDFGGSPPYFVNSLYHLDHFNPMPETCDKCPIRRRAEKKPNSLIAKIWKWHTGWCPGWKSYQESLAEK